MAYFDVSNSYKFQLVFHISQFFMTYKLCPQISIRQFVLRILFVIYLSKLANPFSIWTKQMNINLTWYFILWRNTDFFRNVSILSVNTNLFIVIRNPIFFENSSHLVGGFSVICRRRWTKRINTNFMWYFISNEGGVSWHMNCVCTIHH